jgi:hypothetical protein
VELGCLNITRIFHFNCVSKIKYEIKIKELIMDTSHYNEVGPGESHQFENFSRQILDQVIWIRQILVGILFVLIVSFIGKLI